MVIATDTPIPPVYDVVFVVEKTANLAAYLETLKTSYIGPALEYFNGGPPDPTDYGNDFSCTLYALVTFHAGDISPSPAAACQYPTTSTHKFLSFLDETEFIGGEAQSYSHISEGLSTALQVFDEIKATRNHSIPAERHCILVCNSPPYHLPSEESQDYMGFTSEQLASMLGKRGIYLSIISPRKIPALQRLYEESCSNDIPFSPNKEYTVDPRHLVLLHGFKLQERSHSPSVEEDKTSDLIKSSLGSTRVSSPAPAASTEAQFKKPQPTSGLSTLSQQPSPQQPALSPLNTQTGGQSTQPQPAQTQQPAQPSPQQQQAQQQQQGTLGGPGTGGMSSQPIQQTVQTGQIGMGPPLVRPVAPTAVQTKAMATPMSSATPQQQQQQQPPIVTMATSMTGLTQAPGQQVRPVFQGQIINPTQQGVKQDQSQLFMAKRAAPGQPQTGAMMTQQRQVPATMGQTMTSQGLMVSQQGMTTSQGGIITSQPGIVASQQQGIIHQQNVINTQPNLQQQQQMKIRLSGPGQPSLTASQPTPMSDNVQNVVAQPSISMPSQPSVGQGHFLQQPQVQQAQQQAAGNKPTQMVIQGPGSAPPVSNQVFPDADPTKAAQANKKIIWRGLLEYQEKPKTQGPPNNVQQKNTKTLNCCVSIPNAEQDLNARNWPEKLVMQLLPQPMLHELQSLFRNSRQVSFHFSPNDLESLRNLYRIMGTGFAGCVHFSPTANCDIRVLLLLYSSKKKAFVGLIPNDQVAFVQGIRNVLNKVRSRQNQQVSQPLTTTTLPMQTPPLQIQAPQGIQNNPQMSVMGMQSMPITSTSTQQQSALPIQQDPMAILGQSQEGQMGAQAGMELMGGQQDRASLQLKIQMLENNLQAAKQKELQYQQQEQAKKAAMARQQQIMARQQLQIQQQQQQQQQRLQMQQAATQQQQQQHQQLHHILLNQQNPQGQQTPQQQQMRQQLLLQQQQQNMRGAAPQTQPGVMAGPAGQQPMQSQMTMAQSAQNYLDDFPLPDIM